MIAKIYDKQMINKKTILSMKNIFDNQCNISKLIRMENSKISIIFLLILIISCYSSHSCEIRAFFSPSLELLESVIDELDNAEESISVCMYTFTNRKLAYSLINAKKRGVNIRVILDHKSNENNQYAKGGFLMANGIKVKTVTGLKAENPNDWDGIMHNKFAIIDGKILITGSLNWTASAIAKNYENILILKSCHVIEEYMEEFERLWKEN